MALNQAKNPIISYTSIKNKNHTKKVFLIGAISMSHNPKLTNLQKNISLKELKNSDLNFIEKYISEENAVELNDNAINPIYIPEQTLSMFVSQAINQDGSCQNVVNKLALER
jgi:hypothetical protein